VRLRRMKFSDEEIELYSRQIVLPEIGVSGQEKLKTARVAVIGIGGLGCPTVVSLAAMGVGYIRIVDRDVVEKSNLHRQHLYSYKDLGYPKVEVAARKLKELNPYIEVDPLPVCIDEATARDVVSGVDLVIDGLDNITARRVINEACLEVGTPYLFSSAIQTYGVASLIIPGKTACLECLYANVSDEDLPTCSVIGVHPAILQLISAIQVSEATNYLTRSSSMLEGKLLFCDLKSLSIEFIPVKRAGKCPACGEKMKAPKEAKKYPIVEEVCGREGAATFIVNPGKSIRLSPEAFSHIMRKHEVKPLVSGELGLTFSYEGGLKVSLLKSGVAIIEGAGSKEQALEVYKNIIAEIQLDYEN